MNLPNKITIFRILLIPAIIIISIIEPLKNNYLIWNLSLSNFIILILFLIASFSDFLDGYIARKKNIITDFGKFADPLADKLLVLSLFILLLEQQAILKSYIVIIILARELIVTGFRTLAASKNIIIPANILGKIKTNFQFVLIILLLINGTNTNIGWFEIIIIIFMYLTLVITIISGCEYLIKNKNIFKS